MRHSPAVTTRRLWPKFFLFLTVSLVAAGQILTAQEERRAPELSADTVFNASRYGTPTLRALKGRVVLVFFWTAGDSTTYEALAQLNRWRAVYLNKGFEIVGVYFPEWGSRASRDGLFKRIEALGLEFPILVDDDAGLRSAYGVTAWPAYCLVDRHGYIRRQENGLWDWRGLRVMLEALIEEKGPKTASQSSDVS